MHVENLSYRHHKKCPLFFRDINFELERGRLHALHGKNGTGKTVLFNILSGKPLGTGMIEGSLELPESVALVNQRFDRMIADQFSFEENMKFSRMNRSPFLFSGLKSAEYSADLLQKFNIDPTLTVSKLSGGQRQILALMMALQKNVDLLLLDEPTAALDEENAILVFEYLKTLEGQNLTLLVVCHDRELIERYVTGSHLYLEKDTTGVRTLRMDS